MAIQNNNILRICFTEIFQEKNSGRHIYAVNIFINMLMIKDKDALRKKAAGKARMTGKGNGNDVLLY